MDMFTLYGHIKKPNFLMILAWASPFKWEEVYLGVEGAGTSMPDTGRLIL